MTAVRWGTPALGAVLITACALRVIGLQYGLPAVYNPDEVAIMARALSFAKGTLNPENFLYPTFYFYVLFAWVGLYLGLVWISGGVESLAALRAMYFTAPTGIYTAGRMLGVAAGTATVLALYRLAARIAGERAAIASAVFLAVAPLHVRDSHYVKHDVPATLAIVLAHIAMVRVWPAAAPSGPGRRDVLLAAAACGMAFSTHYYCVFLAVPLALVVARAFAAQGARAIVNHLALAAGVSAAVFLALSPFIAVEPATAWRDIVANREIVVDRGLSAGAFTPAFRYAELLWRDALGIPVFVAGLAGALWMLVAAPGRAVLLLSFPVPFLLFIVNTAPASRYLNPVLPFLALFAGWTLARLFGGLGRAAVFWVAVAVLSAPALVDSIRTGLFFRQDDTRTLAQRYIESTIPPGSTILVQPYSVVLTPTRESLVEALTRNLGSPERASTKFQIQLSLDPYPS
ncbi:MAG TPA: glycosyltransferase family 39 protein, partial [Vicinamibacterales bacterium]|nr:glycosyltransferase family 39 protein [Vicinamibacterales bacterium]